MWYVSICRGCRVFDTTRNTYDKTNSVAFICQWVVNVYVKVAGKVTGKETKGAVLASNALVETMLYADGLFTFVLWAPEEVHS